MKIQTILRTFLAAASTVLMPVAAFAATTANIGTADNPYVVNTADDLVYVATNFNDKGGTPENIYVKLNANIDLTGKEWAPIGVKVKSGSYRNQHYVGGVFDGNGHTIKGMKIATDKDAGGYSRQTGLFGIVSGLTVKNLTMEGANINIENAAGVIIGETTGGANLIENCTVTNCYVKGTRAAGIVGNTFGSNPLTLRNCTVVDSEIHGSNDSVAALIGRGYSNWSVSGCTVKNVTLETTAEGDLPGAVCGQVCGYNVTITDQVVENSGKVPLLGYILDYSTYPVKIRIDGSATSLDVTNLCAKAAVGVTDRIRMWSGKTTYNIPDSERVPGPATTSAKVGDKTWYTINEPDFYIGTEAELRALTNFNYAATTAAYTGDKYFLLTNDIALSSTEWEPIGCKEKSVTPRRQYYFAGTFDGDGHTIAGLTLKTTASTYRGFIGAAAGCIVKNLTLSDVDINISSGSVGAFIGLGASSTTIGASGAGSGDIISNCKLVNSSVSGTTRVGGLYGAPEYGTKIYDCVVTNSSINGSWAGALVGACYKTVICSNTCVFAEKENRVAAFGSVGTGTTIVGGDATKMEITNILQTVSSSLKVDSGLYSEPIPSDCLATLRKNQREMIGEETWYRVVENNSGSGTQDDPYIVENETKLREIAEDPDTYAGTYIKLTADIALTQDWTAFGTDAKPFGGNFNGNGCTITCGSYVQGSFFGTVSNLVVNGLTITLDKPLVGKVVEGGDVSITSIEATTSAALITDNDGAVLLRDSKVVANPAITLMTTNDGTVEIRGDATDMNVAAFVGTAGETSQLTVYEGTFDCAVSSSNLPEYYECAQVGSRYVVQHHKGTGTAEDPYLFFYASEIEAFIADLEGEKTYTNAYIKLAQDITMSSTITQSAADFWGVFDGNGKTIYNLVVDTSLFRYLTGATVKNLTLYNVSNVSAAENSGLLAKETYNSSILNCTVSNSKLKGGQSWGVLPGGISGLCMISNCVVEATTVALGSDYNKRDGFFAGIAEGVGNIIYGCRVSNSSMTDGLKKGAFIGYHSDGSVTLVDCVAENCNLPIVGTVYAEDTGRTLTINGDTTSLASTGILPSDETVLYSEGTVAINAGEYAFDPTAYAGENIVSAGSKTDWYKVTMVVAKIGDEKYTTLDAALAAAEAGDTIKLLQNLTLASRIDINKAITFDLNGKTLTPTETCANGSAINVVADAGNVTIKNGAIDGSAIVDANVSVGNKECDAITVRSGANVTLEDLNVTINSQNGACAYAFDGGSITINSGTYNNKTLVDYQWVLNIKGMPLNQANVATQLITVYGGSFRQYNPANGDDAGLCTSFLADGYFTAQSGEYFVVAEKVAQIGDTYYASFTDAISAAKNGETVTLLKNQTLDARIDVAASGKAITLDLGGKKITRPDGSYSGNGSAFDIKSGTVTIKNGAINLANLTQTEAEAALAQNECDAITVRSGANLTLTGMTIVVDSISGCCVYPFEGGTVAIQSGTYENLATEVYPFNADFKALVVNQFNATPQSLVITGGSFKGQNPATGDDSTAVTSFLAEGYVSTQVNGYWVVATMPAKIGDTKYATLKAAFDAAQEGDTITLLRDVGLTERMVISGFKGTLDLGGYSITNDASWVLTTFDWLFDILGDTSMVIANGTITLDERMLYVRLGAEVTLASDLTINAIASSKTPNTIRMFGGTLNVHGTLTRKGWEGGVIDMPISNSVVNVYDGAYLYGEAKAAKGHGSYIFKLSGGSSTAPTVNIYGGTIDGGGNLVKETGADSPNSTYPVYSYGGNYGVINIYSGTFEHVNSLHWNNGSNATITKLTDESTAKFLLYNSSLASYCADGYTPVKGADSYYTIADASTVMAKIGDDYYAKLHVAVDAVKSGDRIVVLRDIITDYTADYSWPSVYDKAKTDVNFVLDLNDHLVVINGYDTSSFRLDRGCDMEVYGGQNGLGELRDIGQSGHLFRFYSNETPAKAGRLTLTNCKVTRVSKSAGSTRYLFQMYYGGELIVNNSVISRDSVGDNIFASYGSTVTINSGRIIGGMNDFHSSVESKWGTITIPANSTAEFDRDQTQFCADGYATYKANWNSEWYTVDAARDGYDYKVWFVVNGAEEAYAVSNVAANATVGKPADPSAPQGYAFKAWTNATYTAGFDFTTAITADTVLHAYFEESAVTPVEPGTDIPSSDPAADAAAINASVDAKKKVLAPPAGATVGDAFYGYFNAVPGDGVVVMVLNESGTNAVAAAQTTAATSTLTAVLAAESSTSVTVAEPLAGFYYSLKQGAVLKTIDYKTGAKNLVGGKDTITFTLDKPEGSGFYQMIVTPNAVE